MANSATVTISLGVTGDNTWSRSLPVQTNPNSPFEHVPQALSAGANTLTPPTGATYLVIVPPSTSTNAKTLKGITGDTGIPIAPAAPTCIPLPTGAGTLVLNSVGTETVDLYWL